MNSSLELDITDISQAQAHAASIIDFAADRRIFLFYAPMGAGKTTLIKELCRSLGSTDHFSSPTYSIINEYKSPGGRIYHLDLYRLKDVSELLDLGVEDYLDGRHYCFLEWPELAEDLLEGNYVKIQITVNGNNRYLRATLN